MLAGRSPSSDERAASRILAALEGRVPDAEVKHLAPKRRSRLPLALLLVLLTGAAGAMLYSVFDTPPLPVVAESTPPAAQPPQPAAVSPAPAASARVAAADADTQPASAAVIEDHPLAQLGLPNADEDRVPENPLSALAVTAAPPPRAALQAQAAAPKATGPTVQRANTSQAAPKAPPQAAPQRAKTPRNDSDAALLAALMSYGLPPASPPGTKVYKNDGVFVRELPGSPLAARLEQCRKLGFLESEQCRLRVCSGYWGTAPECPNPQAQVEP
ncbi:hypothetical protein FOC84_17255 [Achromobacter pestifer]|uniref:Uncharacterized protein n=1 Tax=Achromobacter pestifer TaxID=1353889 RepID=A0A7D4DZT3_9BURK|nr:hypothetical protein [Achromobacter pestifer]QKH36607.1 hypothetical protein FOC84_17255 [Achromobacter pestifer]